MTLIRHGTAHSAAVHGVLDQQLAPGAIHHTHPTRGTPSRGAPAAATLSHLNLRQYLVGNQTRPEQRKAAKALGGCVAQASGRCSYAGAATHGLQQPGKQVKSCRRVMLARALMTRGVDSITTKHTKTAPQVPQPQVRARPCKCPLNALSRYGARYSRQVRSEGSKSMQVLHARHRTAKPHIQLIARYRVIGRMSPCQHPGIARHSTARGKAQGLPKSRLLSTHGAGQAMYSHT